jgi:flagellar hook-length control protein FliK
MAKSNSISLFASPTAVVGASTIASSTSASSTSSAENSFEQTLKSVRKQKPAVDGDNDTVRAEKPASKKSTKMAKSKRQSAAAKGNKAEDDGSAEEVDGDQASASAQTDGDTDPTAAGEETVSVEGGDHHVASKDAPADAAATSKLPAASALVQQNAALPVAKTDKEAADASTKAVATGTQTQVVAAVNPKAAGASAQAGETDGDGDADATSADADNKAESATKPVSTNQAAPDIQLGTAKVKSAGLMDRSSDNADAATAAAAGAATVAAAPVDPTNDPTASIADALQTMADAVDGGEKDSSSRHTTTNVDGSANASPFEQALQRNTGTATVAKSDATAGSQSPEARFVDVNHPTILNGIHSQLLPNGGTMQIRLDPPELGALQVTVHMRDGIMTASFETSNDDATRMLSHSLNDLKSMLEAGGVNVERMHVQQAPRPESHGNGSDQQQQQRGGEEQSGAKQEQQRRELLQRMWRKLANGSDPLDLVA